MGNRRFFAQSLSERRELIVNGSPFKVLAMMSLPTLMMALVGSLIPLTDGLFLNNSSGYAVAAAVGYSQPVINMINALSQGLATAAMAIIGQQFGKGDMKKVRQVATQLMVFGLGVGVCLVPVAILAPIVLRQTITPELGDIVFSYLSVYAAVIPLLFLAALFNSIKNATGQPEATFYRMVILLGLKIIFNTLFLVIMQKGVVGAALASFCSYLFIAVWMYYDLFVRHSDIQLSLRGFRFEGEIIRQVVRLGIPVMISFFLINLGFFLINTEVARYGPLILNAQTISNNINALAFTLPSSLSTTVTTMVSILVVSKGVEKAKRSYIAGCVASVAISLLLVVTIVPLSGVLVNMFLQNPALSSSERQTIYETSVKALHIATYSIIPFGIFQVTNGAFVGLAKTKITMFSSVLRIWFFRYIFILVFRSTLGVYSVFWGNLFSNTVAAILFCLVLWRSDWKRNLVLPSVATKPSSQA